jgi:hypothetical protein
MQGPGARVQEEALGARSSPSAGAGSSRGQQSSRLLERSPRGVSIPDRWAPPPFPLSSLDGALGYSVFTGVQDI